MDPYSNTREEFTRQLVHTPLPDGAAKKWSDLASKLKVLLEKLVYHEAMKPNIQQTYMTPAASKNRVYFMWDFVGRTLVLSTHVLFPATVLMHVDRVYSLARRIHCCLQMHPSKRKKLGKTPVDAPHSPPP